MIEQVIAIRHDTSTGAAFDMNYSFKHPHLNMSNIVYNRIINRARMFKV